jgi:hypothetical protein
MAKTKEILFDSFKNHNKDSIWFILTFDLKKGSSSDYQTINKRLQKTGLTRGIRAKMRKNKNDIMMNSELPKNIYISKFKVKKSINWMRDQMDRTVRKIFDSQCKRGDMIDYCYFIYLSQEWSWSLRRA